MKEGLNGLRLFLNNLRDVQKNEESLYQEYGASMALQGILLFTFNLAGY